MIFDHDILWLFILPFTFQAISKNMSARFPTGTCFVRSDSRPKLVLKESPTSKRREYSFVEAVSSVDHQLTQSDLKKAYQIAGQKFIGI
jgi:hypothetical protein